MSLQEVLKVLFVQEGIVREGNFRVGIVRVGIFWVGNARGELSGSELSGGELSGGRNLPRTPQIHSKTEKNFMFDENKIKFNGK